MRGPTERLFVAIWPDEAARRALTADVEAARPALTLPASEQQLPPALRWQPPERWHITVAFLGDADPARTVHRIDRLPLPVAEPLRMAGAGAFGPILWVGVQHGPWLAGLAAATQSLLHVPDRRFRAHVTIGRGRGRDAVRAARAGVTALAGHLGPDWTPGELTLVRSTGGPQPRYEVAFEWSLPTDHPSKVAP